MGHNRLTKKQEAFAQFIADGFTQYEAYAKAYDAEQMQTDSVYVAASRLINNAKVALRVTELRENLQEQYLWTRSASVRRLMAVLENDPTNSEVVNAVKELNSMHGWKKSEQEHVVTGQNVTISTGVPEPDAN